MSRPSPASFSPGPPTMPSPGKLWMSQCRAMIASRTVDIPTASAPILPKNRISADQRIGAGVIDVVLQQHQRSRGKSGMDTACGIG